MVNKSYYQSKVVTTERGNSSVSPTRTLTYCCIGGKHISTQTDNKPYMPSK